MSLVIPLPAAPPPANAGPPKSGGRSAPPDGDPFASVLDQQARTATAEGLTKQPDATDANAAGSGRASAGEPAQPTADEAATPAAEGKDPAALAVALNQLLSGEQPAPTVSTAAATPAATTPGTQPATTAVPAGPLAGAASALPAAPAQATPAPAPSPVASPVTETAPATTTAATPIAQPDAAATTATATAATASAAAPEQSAQPTAPQPAAPAAEATTPDAPVVPQQQSGDSDGGQQAAQPRAQTGAPAQQPRPDAAAAATAPAEQAPSPAAAAAAKPSEQAPAHAAPQPVQNGAAAGQVGAHAPGQAHSATAANAAAATAPTARPVTLDHAVETVRLAMRASAASNVTHARISLSPSELGGIDIHLRHTADGLVAKVIADSTGAAQLLQQSASDLRRELEQQGLNLLQLDIGASGEQAGETGAQQGFGDYDGSGAAARRHAEAPADELLTVATDAPAAPRSLQLPNGALVDVLA